VSRALVVMPTYQEAENVADVLRRLRAAAPEADVLIVDDSSPDGTAEVAKDVGHELGGVDVLIRPGKLGLGSAYRAGGIEGLARGYDIIAYMDSDLSHDPKRLPDLLAAVDDGADLAVGSRYVPGGSTPDWPLHRRLLSRWGNRYASFILGLPLRDATTGFRAYRAEALRGIAYDASRADGYGSNIEMVYRLFCRGASIVEIPIEFVDRERGSSKISSRIIVEALALVTLWGIRDFVLGRRRRYRARIRP
jgi:dolichol-phosphate mannosyltransferase